MKVKLGISAAVIAGIACMAPVQAADEIVLGVSYGKTGLYSTINKTTEVAVDIAVAEINAAGGVNGKKIRIVKYDTAGDPKQAVVAVRYAWSPFPEPKLNLLGEAGFLVAPFETELSF